MSGLQLRMRWEADLEADDHEALAVLLAEIYPDFATLFAGRRSWWDSRPEARLIVTDDDEPVAHLGFLRRYLRVAGSSDPRFVQVAEVGLVGVRPGHQGRGVGRFLLESVARVLGRMEIDFAHLTCRDDVAGYFTSGGWTRIDGQITRGIDRNGDPDTFTGPALVLPLRREIDEWPVGFPIVRDGREV